MNYKNYFLMLGLVLLSGQVAMGMEELHDACDDGNVEEVARLLDNGANIEAVGRGHLGLRPLHGAARDGRLEVVQLLLGRGETIEAQTSKGATALHIAACEGKVDVVRCLLQYGANPNALRVDGRTPLFNARVALLRRNPDDYVAIICMLIDAGADTTIRETRNNGTFWECNRLSAFFLATKEHQRQEREVFIAGAEERICEHIRLRNYVQRLQGQVNRNRHDEDQERRGVKPRTSRCLLFNCVVRTQDERL